METPPPIPTQPKRSLRQQLSWHTLVADMRACTRRFPLTVAYVILLSLWGMASVLRIIPEAWEPEGILSYIFFAGALLTLVIYLWTEEQPQSGSHLWLQIAANAVLAADAVWLYTQYDHGLSWAIEIGHGAAIGALATGVFFVSFIGEKDDAASWNFSWSLIKSYVITCAISFVMSLALLAISATANVLLKVDIWDYNTCLMILGCGTIPALIFLGRIPAGASKHDRLTQPSRFLTGLTRYLFVPTMVLLLAILYIYALTILFRFELPNGTVSWPVTGAVAGCFLIEFLLYPSRISGLSRRDAAIARWLPVAVLPLLVLMTVAVLRRISDYGITVERLYLLTFNLWAYGVCIGLFLTRARRLYWVPCSFAGLFLITSILPVNYATLTRSAVQHDLRRQIMSLTDMELPLSQVDYNQLVDEQRLRTRDLIEGKLHYLQDNFGEESLAGIVTIDKERQRYWYARPYAYAESDTVITEVVPLERVDVEFTGVVAIPEGYSNVKRYDYISSYETVSRHPWVIRLTEDSIRFTVNVDSIRSLSHLAVLDKPIAIRPEQPDSALMLITRPYMRFDDAVPDKLDYVDFSGYLFTK